MELKTNDILHCQNDVLKYELRYNRYYLIEFYPYNKKSKSYVNFWIGYCLGIVD